MSRKKSKKKEVLPQETLSQETPEIQEELLEDLLDVKDEVLEDVKVEDVKVEDVKTNVIEANDRVKIKPEIGHDMVGRRIHNGIKNYLYTVKNVRKDGYVTVECLTYVFTIKSEDLILMVKGKN